ncbi:hypothetical protein BSKO_05984 [Bryopsis sp. KO-2023]|nr:hypothetical protein BSKO_05984 [Bryopsis sp. KO-2023]
MKSGPNSPALMAKRISGVGELKNQYKGVLLDQFGVLHDGRKPYPGAIHALQEMHRSGMKVVLLSNSSQRADKAYVRLEGMGFQREWIAGVVTSGELAFRHLRDRPNSFWSNLGRKVLHFTWGSRGKVSLDGLGLEVVSNPSEADFILAHGTETIAQPNADPLPASVDQMKEVLAECISAKNGEKSIPMIVANPDLVTVDTTSLKLMPGTLGKEYERLGGHVEWMGKPAPIIYTSAMQMIGMEPSEVVAIGDSLDHDIEGAIGAGIDSLFICGGIHASDVALNGDAIDAEKLEALFDRQSAEPTFYTSYFKS